MGERIDLRIEDKSSGVIPLPLSITVRRLFSISEKASIEVELASKAGISLVRLPD